MQDTDDTLKQAEKIMMDAMHKAIDEAANHAEAALMSLGSQTSARTYFADVAMRRLFLHLCGADVDTAKGGDPDRAWDMLYIARCTARYWERERGVQSKRRKTESNADLERDKREKSALTHSAQKFAIDTAIRALIEHASISDPTLRERISAAVEARVNVTDPLSQVEQDFAERARTSIRHLLGPVG